MQKKEDNQLKSQEVNDFLILLEYFKNGIKSFFTLIGKLFQLLINFIIHLIIYIRKKLIFLLISGIVGAIIGGIYQSTYNTALYESSMILESDLDSGVQLYQVVGFLNTLTNQIEGSELLSSILSITKEEARQIKKFKVSPIISNLEKIKIFNKKKSRKDAFSNLDPLKLLDLEVDNHEYTKQKIEIVANSYNIFLKLQTPIIEILENSKLLVNKHKNQITNFKTHKNLIEADLVKLREAYAYLEISISKKSNDISNRVYLENDKSELISLKDINTAITTRIKQLDSLNFTEPNPRVFNILSPLSPYGKKVSLIFANPIFTYSYLTVLFTFLILILIEFNRYLNTKKVNNSKI